MEEIEASRKRIKKTMEEEENLIEADEEAEPAVVGSEEMELLINGVLERIERFTQLVSELLEAGKTLFKDLTNEFEDRMITQDTQRTD
ncbi:hypothetical protein BVC80_8619g11 [Macleaya cordata]|uniref:Uncharacterized protein n=1 Tax=Macleaya cordata TaxID=56857 RepID=A0A200PT85_MACCD|nr:hypothetical protein BVC80_8619g11 [Macleaya cordata]